MRIGMSILVLVALGWTAIAGEAAAAERWRITKTHWSQSDERAYETFITALGEADCWTLDECLKSPANIYRHTDPKVRFLADCADLPYFLRAYFAWKNGLPFAYQTAMSSLDGPGTDIRYSSHGNRVVARKSVPATAAGVNAVEILIELRGTISTGMFRHPADADDAGYFTDMYSPELKRQSIRPGTIAYDVNGHVAMVWKVEEDGRILTISSHPDHSLSRSFYGRNFLRTDPALGTNFKNWRPIELVGATQGPGGALVGGHIVAPRNAQIADFSLEQYFGNQPNPAGDWEQARFVHDGEALDYYHYLRAVMATGDLVYNPVTELRTMMHSLCQDIEARKLAVDLAVANGLPRQPHPGHLPDNIYGTYGTWEVYSTPSRDARLKTSFKEMKDHIASLIDLHRQASPRIAYAGSDLVGDLLATYGQESQACRIAYRRTDGKSVTLTLDNVRERLFDLSFDPFHCVERRWGARGQDELASCRDDGLKTRWYAAEAPLRRQIDRTYDVFMGHDLPALEAGPFGIETGKGVAEAPDVDLPAYLENLAERRSAAGSL